MSGIEHSVEVTACQNCGGPFHSLSNCPADRDGIHVEGGVVEVVPAAQLRVTIDVLDLVYRTVNDPGLTEYEIRERIGRVAGKTLDAHRGLPR